MQLVTVAKVPIHWYVANTGFVIQELDSVQFLYDTIFCFESDYLVVSFSSCTGFLGGRGLGI